MMILGIDPGGTTGLAMLDVRSPREWSIETREMPADEALDWLHWELLHSGDVDLVAIERFFISARTARLSAQHDAIEIIGAVRMCCRATDTDMVRQSPADAKTVWPDHRLQSAGITVRGEHARDAARHAALASLRHCGIVLGCPE